MGHAAGEVIDGRYRLRRLIHEGATSVLFEARHGHTDRTVTVQLLTDEARPDRELRTALLEEARCRTLARHPYVVAVLDAGMAGPEDPYLVAAMDEGRTLDGLLASRTQLLAAEVLPMALTVTEALACAHARGVIHGALDAASVLLPSPTFDPWAMESGQTPPAAKLLDLGRAPRPGHSTAMVPLGGFGYAPSEQLAGAEPDARGDVYSLGAVLFEALSGQLPPADSPPSVLGGVLAKAEVPAQLAAIVTSALAPREHRPATMMTLLEALRHAAADKPMPKTAPPPRRRRVPRAAYLTPVYLARRGEERSLWSSQDISEGGMLIIGPRVVSTGEKVHIRFAMPGSGEEATLTAMIRWLRPAKDDQAAVGVEFIGPPAALVEDIREYVAFFSKDETSP